MNVDAGTLPARPSELLRLAISLLPQPESKERLILGELIERHVLGIDPEDARYLPADVNRKLLAVNALQRGCIRQAFAYLKLPYLSVDDWVQVVPYHFSPEKFTSDLHQIVHALELRGY